MLPAEGWVSWAMVEIRIGEERARGVGNDKLAPRALGRAVVPIGCSDQLSGLRRVLTGTDRAAM